MRFVKLPTNITRITRAFASAFALLILIVSVACQTVPKARGPVFTVRVLHITNDQIFEDQHVRVGESFLVADTDVLVEVKRFVPDFAINLKTKEVISRSERPLNPALQLAVSLRDDPLYETWVLYENPMPHGVHDPGYYFQFIAFEGLGNNK